MANTVGRCVDWLVGFSSRRALTVTLLVLAMLSPGVAYAQGGTADESSRNGRKVLVRVKPDYSVLLRGSNIGGTVRLNATVLPNGTVAKISVLGGNPILAESAVKAVMQWKFAPGPIQTNEAIQLSFH